MVASRRAQRRGQRGFSLLEILIVMAVIGLALSIGIGGVGAAFKRQKLATAGAELKTLAGRTLTEMQNRNVATFLVFGKYITNHGTDAAVVIDSNGNGTLDIELDADGLFKPRLFVDDVAYDLVLYRVHVPEDIALSSTSPTGQSFNAQWSRPSSGPISAVIMCDFLGRATIPGATATMITAPATVQLSHREMISGKLTPLQVVTLSIGPLFKASTTRVP